LCFSLFATQVSAQTQDFVKGNSLLSFGIGLGGNLYSGSGYSSKIPPISVHYEYCVKDNLFDEKSSLGIGAMLGYTSAKWEYSGWGGSYGWKYTSIIVGAKGALHYAFVDKLDTYAGLMLGYNIVSAKEIGDWGTGTTYKASGSAATSYFFIGGRYYFSDNLAAFAELGYGMAILNLGITLKF